MKRIILISATALALSACDTSSRYKTLATACGTYAVALQTAAGLNSAGKLSPASVARIDATIPPAKAVCSGPAPSDDVGAAQKVSAAIIAVLEAQGDAK